MTSSRLPDSNPVPPKPPRSQRRSEPGIGSQVNHSDARAPRLSVSSQSLTVSWPDLPVLAHPDDADLDRRATPANRPLPVRPPEPWASPLAVPALPGMLRSLERQGVHHGLEGARRTHPGQDSPVAAAPGSRSGRNRRTHPGLAVQRLQTPPHSARGRLARSREARQAPGLFGQKRLPPPPPRRRRRSRPRLLLVPGGPTCPLPGPLSNVRLALPDLHLPMLAYIRCTSPSLPRTPMAIDRRPFPPEPPAPVTS